MSHLGEFGTVGKHSKCALLAMLAVVLSACAHTPQLAEPNQQVQVVSIEIEPVREMPSPDFIRRLATIELQIAQYPVPGLWPQRWWYEARAAELLAKQGYTQPAQERLAKLEQEVPQQSADYYALHARQYFQQAQQFARMDERQSNALRALEYAVHREEFRSAYLQGQALVRELWSAQGWVSVRGGESLAQVSARPSVYDNANLWPLLMQANKGLIRTPKTVLQSGWSLRYPLHPRLDEIFAAAEFAVSH